MALAEEIRALRDRVLADLDSAHDYYTDTRIAWRLVRKIIAAGHRFAVRKPATGTMTTETYLAARARGYVAKQLTEATFHQFISIFENFLFDLLRTWMTAYPQSLGGKQVPFKSILDAPDKDAITQLVVARELNEVLYDRPAKWFAYLEDKVRLGCPGGRESWACPIGALIPVSSIIFPPLRRGGRGGGHGVTGCAASPFSAAQDSPSIGYTVWSGCPSQCQGFSLTPPTPPSQGGERNRVLALIHRATKGPLAKTFPRRVKSDFPSGQGCPMLAEIEMLAEAKATRDTLVHNRGIAGEVYVRKAGRLARFKPQEPVEISEQYHREIWALVRKVVSDVSGAAIGKAP